MAIDYAGHCRLSIGVAQARIQFMRSAHPDWFSELLQVSDAMVLGPFGLEISREFGIEAQSKFMMAVRDKTRLAEVTEVVEYVYEVFGTDDLVITWGHDSVRPALRSYAPIPIAPAD